ncbi:MAG: preprotein translocase subunit SecG [Allosphingosinicella sp.]|uniref:preprotein translocase subunit SecG n=1 Tax=Allosphingosinicella sp. TaxID=2823234 RepID=UPI003945F31A
MFEFLLIVQTLVAVAMITVILMQRSEGGGLGVGSSSSTLMTARGAADFLTRSTSILAVIFVALSIALAGLAAGAGRPRTIDPTLMQAPPAGAPAERQQTPFDIVPGAPPQQPGSTVPGAAPSAPGEPAPGAPAPGGAAPQPAQPVPGQ